MCLFLVDAHQIILVTCFSVDTFSAIEIRLLIRHKNEAELVKQNQLHLNSNLLPKSPCASN